MTAGELRRELSERNLAWAPGRAHEVTFGRVPSVVYGQDEQGSHGNFLAAAYRRIGHNPAWRARLEKAYTSERWIARSGDRAGRGELECGNSSDALLMNVFCSPGTLGREGVCRLLGVGRGLRPEFGVRVGVPLRAGVRKRAGEATDRTEVDMQVGNCLIEAKLTETDFQTARSGLVERYRDLHEVFAHEEMPRVGELYGSYQLIRGVLASFASEGRFVVLSDERRGDLIEQWFGVLRAVKSAELRSRLGLVTWQELAGEVAPGVRRFLAEKYGIMSR